MELKDTLTQDQCEAHKDAGIAESVLELTVDELALVGGGRKSGGDQ